MVSIIRRSAVKQMLNWLNQLIGTLHGCVTKMNKVGINRPLVSRSAVCMFVIQTLIYFRQISIFSKHGRGVMDTRFWLRDRMRSAYSFFSRFKNHELEF